MSELITVDMQDIRPNPFRLIDDYPYIKDKLNSLIRSINDVGFWEGVIARETPVPLIMYCKYCYDDTDVEWNSDGSVLKCTRCHYGLAPIEDFYGYQIAFGHHRIEAAKRAGLTSAPIIVRDLTDEQMIQFMGRENGEDYKADFLTMLNTWEGAIKYNAEKYLVHDEGPQTTSSVSSLLGWTREREDREGSIKPTAVAEACANAHKLIADGHMQISDLAGMSVSAVRDLVARTQARIKDAEAASERQKLSKTETKKAVKKIASAAKSTAEDVRKKKVAPKDIATTVDKKIRQKIAHFETVTPEFHKLAERMAKKINNALTSDAVHDMLEETEKCLQYIRSEKDRAALKKLDVALHRLSELADSWRTRLAKKPKIVDFKAIERGK